jgi:hypothetical protein
MATFASGGGGSKPFYVFERCHVKRLPIINQVTSPDFHTVNERRKVQNLDVF